MIVDDNVDVAQMLAMLVETLGHQVVVEHSSESALARARLERPHVCLLDIGLPDIDGNELARRLRAKPEMTQSILIAVTGYGHEQDRKYALEAGFSHHLVKPVDTNKLARLLREIDQALAAE
jgi:CheY-like chemotaxis protein